MCNFKTIVHLIHLVLFKDYRLFDENILLYVNDDELPATRKIATFG